MSGLNRYADAAQQFIKYSKGGRSLQVTAKGLYWAGRALLYANRGAEATTYFTQAAAYPELFYGQLSLERLGRPVPAPAGVGTAGVRLDTFSGGPYQPRSSGKCLRPGVDP
jgi:soluble lytic murein transglycosylase